MIGIILIWAFGIVAIIELWFICHWSRKAKAQASSRISLAMSLGRAVSERNLLFKFFYNCRVKDSVREAVQALSKSDFNHLLSMLKERELYSAIQATKKLREIG